ncbi:hypothetical protein [Neisseria sp. Ec49-e6-T10]|uniref:hypothetical protein n=1 Tax=Neisseria sp. Ec49-e6-T10 TaxID=3140744 RepID=UPI003EC01C73
MLALSHLNQLKAYLRWLDTYISQYGLPIAIYSDWHSIFSKHKAENFVLNQLKRTLDNLGIESIQASTSQAKE